MTWTLRTSATATAFFFAHETQWLPWALEWKLYDDGIELGVRVALQMQGRDLGRTGFIGEEDVTDLAAWQEAQVHNWYHYLVMPNDINEGMGWSPEECAWRGELRERAETDLLRRILAAIATLTVPSGYRPGHHPDDEPLVFRVMGDPDAP